MTRAWTLVALLVGILTSLVLGEIQALRALAHESASDAQAADVEGHAQSVYEIRRKIICGYGPRGAGWSACTPSLPISWTAGSAI